MRDALPKPAGSIFAEDRFRDHAGRADIASDRAYRCLALADARSAITARMEANNRFWMPPGILQHYIDGRQKRTCAASRRTLGQCAVLGQRSSSAETSDFMAVVNYGCAADGLSGAGGKANDMTSFAETALKPGVRPCRGRAHGGRSSPQSLSRKVATKLAHGENVRTVGGSCGAARSRRSAAVGTVRCCDPSAG